VSLIQEKLIGIPIDVQKFRTITTLTLRQNYIKEIKFLEGLTTLTHLDLYDNLIKKIDGIQTLVNLMYPFSPKIGTTFP